MQPCDKVTFFIPAWDEMKTAYHAAELQEIERYVRLAGRGMGLFAEDIAEDLNDRFGTLGAITVTRSIGFAGMTFCVEIENQAQAA